MLYLLKIEKNADMDLCIWYNEKGLAGEIETKGMRNMDKYTVLLVDDEEEVIQVIMKKIDWEELGLSVIGYASNGVKALELVEEFQPDIVMTDIKMTYMDGMELSQQIKREFPATKILIFTGFDEFEYAKEAVHLEVEEYILKPVNAAELKEVFIQVKNKLDQEISEKRSVEVLQRYYMESLPVLRANFYSTLIEGRIQENELPKYLQDYQIAFAGPLFCCLVIHTSSRQVPEGMNPLLLDTSVRKQAEERLGEKWRAKSFSYLGNTVMIVQFEEEWQVADLTDECDRFCRYARRMIGAVVTVGVGKVCRDVLELAKSYIGAREAVSYRAIYGASRAVNIREIDPQETAGGNPTDDTRLGELFKRICLGSEQEVREAARKANIAADIEKLPGSYDFMLAEGGTNLSGGQRQRIALARVFLRKPRILILDEATSALDNTSEKHIQQEIEAMKAECGTTVISIAHRLTTLQNCDEILVMDQGRIVQRGTFRQLEETPGIFRDMARGILK